MGVSDPLCRHERKRSLMSTNTKTAIEREGRPRAGVSRSEPGGRAQRDAGGARAAGAPVEQLPDEVRERLSDELIDELLAGARSEEEIVGPGGLLVPCSPASC